MGASTAGAVPAAGPCASGRVVSSVDGSASSGFGPVRPLRQVGYRRAIVSDECRVKETKPRRARDDSYGARDESTSDALVQSRTPCISLVLNPVIERGCKPPSTLADICTRTQSMKPFPNVFIIHEGSKILLLQNIIPGALGIDPRPIPCADGDDALGVVDEKQPCLSAGFDDRLVAVPDEAAQFVASEIIPDVLHRVQFR